MENKNCMVESDAQEFTSEIEYFTASTYKLVLMSFLTMGIYNQYWFYKNWVAIKKSEKPDILPFWRAIFAQLWSYSVFFRVQRDVNERNISLSVFAGASAFIYFFMQALWKLPELYWILGMFSFLPLVPANRAAAELNREKFGLSMKNKKITKWNLLLIILFAPFLVFNTVISTPTYTNYLLAEDSFENGEFRQSKILYEKSIESCSTSFLFGWYEYEIRFSYGRMLNEYSKISESSSDLFLESRLQFEWVIDYLDENPELISTKAQALSNLANTYQQQAAATDSNEEYFKLLEVAFRIYRESAEQLEVNQDWKNLSYTYYNLGQTSDWYGDVGEAIKWLEKAVELDKKFGFSQDFKEDSEYLNSLKDKYKKINESKRDFEAEVEEKAPSST